VETGPTSAPYNTVVARNYRLEYWIGRKAADGQHKAPMEHSDQRIAKLSLDCQSDYQSLSEALDVLGDKSTLSSVAIQNELGRFRIWVKEIGAMHKEKHSLDFKLRDIEHLRQGIIMLLEDLKESLRTELSHDEHR
jgi:hypothetical protein